MHPNLADAALFSGVDPKDVAELCDRLDKRCFKTGSLIFEQGEPPALLYIIADGKVKIGTSADDGRENLFQVLGPSDMFGELAMLDPGPRISSARALTDVEVVTMNRTTLREWLAPRPQVAEQLMRVLARRLRRITTSRSDLVLTDAPGRVAKLLLRLAQRFGVQRDGSVLVNHDLTQDEIAQLVGSSRETVNTVLSDFSNRGWIELHSKGLLISDTERLARRAHA
ncbi:Crp/Fnr family transcriptional regulator [Mycolicibacterium sp. P1-5]|uniref:Crp/Fnr family transcriptional regulator n=1 Tax=Mycolicibacterium sp. P1-5 TaxID=2024617 RepID=UPI0011EBD86E|nr:Crp/Fnr family transcriptional regulator [Mycolicibacterium sp. P1-5]KAA0111069.1 Crp/Fnr family transcriptional regulator [Mycolicibacterium sp. P1-5]